MNPDERRLALEQIAAEVAVCTRCPLHEGRTLAVPGEGHFDTEVVFVGEGPGYNEDQQGRPFVGAAGGLLNELLKAIGWKRQEVFITNVVKCRPPGNRDPEPTEIAACAAYLRRQLEVLDPAVVVTLGRYSLGHFMPGERISAVHGTMRPADSATGAPNALAYAMYHPAAALRQGSLKQTMLADMAGLPETLLESRLRRTPAEPETPETPETRELPEMPEISTAENSVAAEPPALPEPVVSAPTPTASEPVAIDIQPEAIVIDIEPVLVAVAGSPAETELVDENQMQLFG